MTLHSKTLRLRRLVLSQAVRTLSDAELRILMFLLLGACPNTHRVWTTMTRLTEDLVPIPTPTAAHQVEEAVRHIVSRGFLSLWCARGALSCYEVGPLLVREDAAPANIPVEPDP